MKKSFGLMLLLTINLVLVFFFWQYSTTKADQKGPIPQNAIRLRILANSDSPADQAVKRQVRDAVNKNITQWVQNLKTSDQAKQVIRAHMPELRATVEQTLKQAHARSAYKIKLGQANFPTKMYGSFVYPAGKYDALVVTLGDGKGANWWCVLFPPLCFLDFSNSEAVANPKAAVQEKTSAQSALEPAKETKTQQAKQPKQSEDSPTVSPAKQPKQSGDPTAESPKKKTDQVEVHSFVVDFFTKVWHSIAG
ncbi:stage II sporulation protein R [Sporolactobacillus shoreicorticis]|uniref:Stage II sporulation protein R n=1 Tax=Sporolactobacillus shoreicorticis TaxID=1923877 RepID=A0ABW5S835_9BACL|nr:stage II sporulation protein R [Sporolactobacillus shoreicorticis]MCO7125603.1 stage II sporulation protein R [Sporolactobacillus shoreicorticis]